MVCFLWTEFLRYTQCLDEENFHRVYALLDRSVTQANFVMTYFGPDRVVPGLCCTFHMLYVRITRLLDQTCSTPTSNGAIFVHAFLDISLRDMVNLVCAKVPNLNSCDRKFATEMRKLRSGRIYQHASSNKKPMFMTLFNLAYRSLSLG